MMYLRETAEELGLSRLVERALEYEQVQGIVLTVDPRWLWLLRSSANPIYQRWLIDYRMRGYPPYMLPPLLDEMQDENLWTLDPDFFRRRPRYWEEVAHYLDLDPGMPPIIAKVCHITGRKPEGIDNVESRLRIVTEARPVAHLSASRANAGNALVGGVSVGDQTRSAGTLGGILKGDNGAVYGVTCEHVAKANSTVYQPAIPDGGQNPALGKVVFAAPSPVSPNGLCNPYANRAWQQAISALDVSLIEIDAGLRTTGPSGITGMAPASGLHPGLLVDFVGRTSGQRTVQVEGLAVTYRFQDKDGMFHCLHDLFEVRWPRLARTHFDRPVAGGDSGAWVTGQGATGTEWCGMLVGEDRIQGYAMFAEHVMNTLNNAGYRLLV